MARIAGVNIPTNKRVLIALQYIHGIGQKNAAEIVEKVKLPAHLADDPYLFEHYGTVEWSVRSIFAGYMGWFGGDPASLSFDAPDVRAREVVDLAGGQALGIREPKEHVPFG